MKFINNKYSKWYFNIISTATSRVNSTGVYLETHHIIPTSLGGTNDQRNLVRLTGREHFICHLLLCKMTTGKEKASMCFAAMQMTARHTQERYIPASKIYEILKKQLSETLKGKNYNSRYGENAAVEIKKKIGEKSKGRKPMLGMKLSEETKKKISASKTGISLPKSESHKKKISDALKNAGLDHNGDKNPMFNKTHQDTTKQLISTANKGKKNGMFEKYKNAQIIECPHCNKKGKECPNFIRHHFDKCKKVNNG